MEFLVLKYEHGFSKEKPATNLVRSGVVTPKARRGWREGVGSAGENEELSGRLIGHKTQSRKACSDNIAADAEQFCGLHLVVMAVFECRMHDQILQTIM